MQSLGSLVLSKMRICVALQKFKMVEGIAPQPILTALGQREAHLLDKVGVSLLSPMISKKDRTLSRTLFYESVDEVCSSLCCLLMSLRNGMFAFAERVR